MRVWPGLVALAGCEGIEERLVGTWEVVEFGFDGGERYASEGTLTLDVNTGACTEVVDTVTGELLRFPIEFFLWDVTDDGELELDDQPFFYEVWDIDALSSDHATLSDAFGPTILELDRR